jgi:hypothetical protein
VSFGVYRARAGFRSEAGGSGRLETDSGMREGCVHASVESSEIPGTLAKWAILVV